MEALNGYKLSYKDAWGKGFVKGTYEVYCARHYNRTTKKNYYNAYTGVRGGKGNLSIINSKFHISKIECEETLKEFMLKY